MSWEAASQPEVGWWVLQIQKEQDWTTQIFPRQQTSYLLIEGEVDKVAISAVTRYGIQGESRVVEMRNLSFGGLRSRDYVRFGAE